MKLTELYRTYEEIIGKLVVMINSPEKWVLHQAGAQLDNDTDRTSPSPFHAFSPAQLESEFLKKSIIRWS